MSKKRQSRVMRNPYEVGFTSGLKGTEPPYLRTMGGKAEDVGSHDMWRRLHIELREMQKQMAFKSSQEDYIRLYWGSTWQQLEKHCRKIINIVDSWKDSEARKKAEND